MHEDGLAIGRPLRAQIFGVGARVEVAVHEVGDDINGALDVEFLEGLRQEIVGDSGDAVALLDGKTRNREVAAIAADESDVRAVERSDERQAPWSSHRESQ